MDPPSRTSTFFEKRGWQRVPPPARHRVPWQAMAAYRDDLEAAVARASALEAELLRVKQRQREDRAGYLVKVSELESDLLRERERLRELEARVTDLSGQAFTSENVAELVARLEASRAHLDAIGKDVAAVRAAGGAWASRRRRLMAATIVVAAVLAGGLSLSLVLYSRARADIEASRREAIESLWQATYTGHRRAAETLDRALATHSDHPGLLADAARVQALLALELGTDDDGEAEALIDRAADAGASPAQLAPARAAVSLARWNMHEVDATLIDAAGATGEAAVELIYLRGLWHLRRGDAREALRRFDVAARESPRDMRYELARTTALHEAGDRARALESLDRIATFSPGNVASLLLRARIALEAAVDPAAADRASAAVLEATPGQTSQAQYGWAILFRARALLALDRRDEALIQMAASRAVRPERDPEHRALAARVSVALGDLEAAESDARRATVIAPEIPRFQEQLAEILIMRGDLENAEIVLRTLGLSDDHGLWALLRARRLEADPSQLPDAAL